MAVINHCLGGGLEITELTLGLPGGGGGSSSRSLEIMKINEKKRVFSEIINEEGRSSSNCSTTKESKTNHHHHHHHRQDQEEGGGGAVVGWPPVCSYRRKNSFNNNNDLKKEKKKKIKMIKYVKVSMDGAPFLRKLDLSAYKQYSHLLFALQNLFGYSYFCEDALKKKDGMSSIISSDYYYVPIYEDKDGDWMLVGDVPWNMFTESCKRLRIMKKTEAKKGINNIASSNSADLFIHS